MFSPLTEPPPAAPEGVMAVPGSASVTVSWEAVDDADRYTVTFTRATGDDQQGGCPGVNINMHIATASVDTPTTTVSINVGQLVEEDVTDMLRAYSTYFITVVAVSDAGGPSEDSQEIQVLTPQIGMRQLIMCVCYSSSYCVCACVYVCLGAGLPPGGVVVTVEGPRNISIQWGFIFPCRARNGLITDYRVQYTAQPDGMVQTNQTVDREITLMRLTPFTNYSIEVAAVNEEGDVGVYSEPQYVVTDEDGNQTIKIFL